MFSLLRRGPGRLTPQAAHQQVSDGTALLLDVRETPEWNAGHAPEALHLPLSRLVTGAPLPATVRGRPMAVVAICRSGHRSRQAARLLAGRGVQAKDVTGGMTAWARAGLPVSGPGNGDSNGNGNGNGNGVIA